MLHWLSKLQLWQSCRNNFDKKDKVLLKVWKRWFFKLKGIVLQKVPLTVEEDSFDKPTEKFLTKRSIFSTGSLKLKKNHFSKKVIFA